MDVGILDEVLILKQNQQLRGRVSSSFLWPCLTSNVDVYEVVMKTVGLFSAIHLQLTMISELVGTT